jgi:tetratricopeptide (TPR) repeat protein
MPWLAVAVGLGGLILTWSIALYFRERLYKVAMARGVQALQRRHFGRAAVYLGRAVWLKPRHALAYVYRGAAHHGLRYYYEAFCDYSDSIRLDPTFHLPYNLMAWMWATCPEPRVRDGSRAIEYATRACELTNWANPRYIDTLAAAFAEGGAFELAALWQWQALESPEAFPPAELRRAHKRLELYDHGQPYRDGAKE